MISPSSLLILLLWFQCADGYLTIEPGMGLIQQLPIQEQHPEHSSTISPLEIVIFEHTDIAGTGGLVLNCPTPLQLGSIAIPRFHAFKHLPLMLGCCDDESNGNEREDLLVSASSLPLGDLAPWFWLHNMEGLSGSFALQGATGPLYMGGNLEEATERLMQHNIDPAGRFKFFRKYQAWTTGQLEKELRGGKWKLVQQDPVKALEAVKSRISPLLP